MNSDERRKARRARRDAKRAANRAKRCAALTISNAARLDNIHEAARDAAKGVRWKASVQRYIIHSLRNSLYARRDLLAGNDIRKGFVRFHVIERGKDRAIAAPRFSERVIQKAVTRAVMAPAVWPTLTPGCAANMRGRGTDYALMRLKGQLAEHYRRHGAEGYVLLMDFSDYFGTIDHGTALDLVRRTLTDPAAVEFMRLQIEANGRIGLGLGSEPNQALAVAIPSPLVLHSARQGDPLAVPRRGPRPVLVARHHHQREEDQGGEAHARVHVPQEAVPLHGVGQDRRDADTKIPRT